MNSLYKQRQSIWQKLTFISFFLLFFILGPFSLKTLAATVGEEFYSSEAFDVGMVVSLKKENPKDIELTTISNREYILGIVNGSGSNLVTYAKEDSDVVVSLAGIVQVFVTNANGEISKGDFIGASWLEGVGMKADLSDKQRLLGVALEDFSSENAKEYGEIETADGRKDVKIGTVSIRIFDKESSGEVAFTSSGGLENILKKIAGKEVSLAKIIAVSVIFVTGVLISGFFVSSSIRGSFISLGRNPRASSSIYRSLLHVTMVAIVVILMGTMLSYVVLVI